MKILVFCVVLCYGQNVTPAAQEPATELQNEILIERIGNFSLEIVFHTSKILQEGENFIVSPISVWGMLAVIAEGASGRTRLEMYTLLRLTHSIRDATRIGFGMIAGRQVGTNTARLDKFNAILVDKSGLLIRDYQDIAIDFYKTQMIIVDFKKSERSANLLNAYVANLTRGSITDLFEPSYFQHSPMLLANALYFKGQWSVPFNASSTVKMSFYDSNGQKTGDVNMMYSRHAYPFSIMPELQAKVIELSYGDENRLSMVIMLPNPGVSLETMFVNFGKVNLYTLFENLRVSKEDLDYEVNCFIPRFKIKSDIDLLNVLRNRMGINQLFNESGAQLPYLARYTLYVSKVVHKTEIEVTEEGTGAAALTAAGSSDRTVEFQADRPFAFFVIEKVTNSIVFGGFYKTPTLY